MVDRSNEIGSVSAQPGAAGAPPLLAAVERLEGAEALDRAVDGLSAVTSAQVASPKGRHLLGGGWLGHALHPLLTDLPIGAWTSASVLDLVGGRQSAPAARRLVGFGILAAVPTAATGLSDWTATTREQKRVGVVHAATNSVALTLYVASFLARGRHRGRGAVLGMLGGLVAAGGGYLGGHLALATDAGMRASRSATGARPSGTSNPLGSGDVIIGH